MSRVLVTGANRGIGLATTVALARAGHEIVATMRTPAKATKLHDIVDAEGLAVTTLAMDVDSDGSVVEAFARTLGEGAIDVLVNNAGIERHGSVEELPLSEFRAVMETNYFGAIRCIQAVLPHMRARGSGCIVNVSSVAGRLSSSPLAPYTASKFALEAMAEVLAQEVKPLGIRVALVEPGIIDTDMAHDIAEPGESSYPNSDRAAALFHAVLAHPVGPEVVAAKILEIVEGDSWQLRHPVGPDSEERIAARRAMSDEDWIDRHAVDDEAWATAFERRFGVDPRR